MSYRCTSEALFQPPRSKIGQMHWSAATMLAFPHRKLTSYYMSLRIRCSRNLCLVSRLTSGSLSYKMVANPAFKRDALKRAP